MNWVTRREFPNLASITSSDIEFCEHVRIYPDETIFVKTENDSFGEVSVIGLCDTCNQNHLQQEDQRIVNCTDCSRDVVYEQAEIWREYDATNYDDEHVLCSVCAGNEKHLKRVERDHYLYEVEFGDCNDY